MREEYEFGLSVGLQDDGEWKVVIDHMDEERAATFCQDLDTALKMALPYIATCCEPDPLTAAVRAAMKQHESKGEQAK